MRAAAAILLLGCSGAVRDPLDGSFPTASDLRSAADLARPSPGDGPPGPGPDGGWGGGSVVVINEVFADGSGATPDFAEIRNLGNVPVDLSGFMVADDKTPFTLPMGTKIPAGGHLVIYCDKAGAGPPGIYTLGRLPDGTGPFASTTPTPGTGNQP